MYSSSIKDMDIYNVCIIGWSQIAREALRILSQLESLSIQVICGPRQMDDDEAISLHKEFSSNSGPSVNNRLNILITEEISAAILKLDTTSSIGLSFDSPIIFKQHHIDHFSGRLINEHGAPLPDGRGGGGFSWRIMEGDNRGSVLFHMVDQGIDTGDIVYRRDFEFPESCRYPSDYENYQLSQAILNIPAFLELVLPKSYWENQICRAQDKGPSLYFPRLYTPVNAWIDWNWSASQIRDFILAFSYPYPGAKCTLNDSDSIIKIFDAEISGQFAAHHPFKSGLIYYNNETSYWSALRCVSRHSQEAYKSFRELKIGDRFISSFDRLYS